MVIRDLYENRLNRIKYLYYFYLTFSWDVRCSEITMAVAVFVLYVFVSTFKYKIIVFNFTKPPLKPHRLSVD